MDNTEVFFGILRALGVDATKITTNNFYKDVTRTMMQLKQWLRPLILGLVVQLAVVMVPNTALAAWLNFEDMYAGATSEGLFYRIAYCH